MTQLVTSYPDGLKRCSWPKQDQLYLDYHDTEWGVEVTGDNALFEAISLEGFQAGLSWITILRRRDGFRKAFRNFEISRVAKMSDRDIERLMQNPEIIRNRAKIKSTIENAKTIAALDGSLTEIIWSHAPKIRTKKIAADRFEFQATSPESENLSRELKSIGLRFVGPTTMYAMMQSIGMINDHAPGCFRRKQLRG